MLHRHPLIVRAALWLAATVATLVTIDRAVVGSGFLPASAFRAVTGYAGAFLDPAIVLPGLAVVAAAAVLGRTAVLGAWARRQGARLLPGAWGLLKSGFAATLLAMCLKTATGRARPAGDASAWLRFDPFTFQEQFQSMPSAHAAFAGAVTATAARLWPGSLWLWLCIAGLAGATRILSGDHWPSDVVAGMGLGALVGGLLTRSFAPAGKAAVALERRRPASSSPSQSEF